MSWLANPSGCGRRAIVGGREELRFEGRSGAAAEINRTGKQSLSRCDLGVPDATSWHMEKVKRLMSSGVRDTQPIAPALKASAMKSEKVVLLCWKAGKLPG